MPELEVLKLMLLLILMVWVEPLLPLYCIITDAGKGRSSNSQTEAPLHPDGVGVPSAPIILGLADLLSKSFND